MDGEENGEVVGLFQYVGVVSDHDPFIIRFCFK